MKKIILLGFLITSIVSYSQQELKIDVLDALAVKTLELSYEYYLSEENSIGVSTLFNFEKKSADFRYNEYQMVTPYFRHYFSTDRQWNIFGELFLGINSGYKRNESDGGSDTFTNYSDGAFGVSAGAKYFSGNGLVFSFHAGLGRNLFSTDSYIIVPRLGANIGWRF